jgi:hypothetical protein
MSIAQNNYIVSRIDQSIADLNNKLCECIVKVDGCSTITGNMNNYPSNCLNKCNNVTEGVRYNGYSSDNEKYKSTLPVIIELFKLLLLQTVKDENNDLIRGIDSYAEKINRSDQYRGLLKVLKEYGTYVENGLYYDINELNNVHDEIINSLACTNSFGNNTQPIISINEGLLIITYDVENSVACGQSIQRQSSYELPSSAQIYTPSNTAPSGASSGTSSGASSGASSGTSSGASSGTSSGASSGTSSGASSGTSSNENKMQTILGLGNLLSSLKE